MTTRLTALLLLFSTILPTAFGQKITIQFAATPTATPSVSKAILKFNKDFAYSFTFDDGTIDAFTCGMPVLKGGFVSQIGVAYPSLFTTDGCGNDVPFGAGIAWNSVNQLDVDVHEGNVADRLTWRQLDTLFDAGWDVLNHSYSHRSRSVSAMSASDYVFEILQNMAVVKQKTRLRLETPTFVVPAGDDNYPPFAFQNGAKVVFNQSGDVIGYSGLRLDADVDFSKVIHRQLLEESISSLNFLDSVAKRSVGGVHIWYNEFTHRIDDFGLTGFNFYVFKNHIQRIAATWGKQGSDRVWFAPLEEVSDYLRLRQTLKIAPILRGQQIDVTFDFSQIPMGLRRKTVTLLVNSATDFTRVDASAGIRVVSFRGSGDVKIINLDFSNIRLSASDLPKTALALYLSPNPTVGILTVEVPNATVENGQISVFDTAGRVVLQGKMVGQKAQLLTASLAHGAFVVVVREGQQIWRGKFIIN